MRQLSFETNISVEQFFALLSQLSANEKLALAKQLRFQASTELWGKLPPVDPTQESLTMDEIVEEVKTVRRNRTTK